MKPFTFVEYTDIWGIYPGELASLTLSQLKSIAHNINELLNGKCSYSGGPKYDCFKFNRDKEEPECDHIRTLGYYKGGGGLCIPHLGTCYFCPKCGKELK